MKIGKPFPVSDLPSSGLARNKAETARKIRAAHSFSHVSEQERKRTKQKTYLADLIKFVGQGPRRTKTQFE